MKQILCLAVCLLFWLECESAQVVVFDFGGVLGNADKKYIKEFVQCTFQVSEETLTDIFHHWRISRKRGVSDAAFWEEMSQKYRIPLPEGWLEELQCAIYSSIRITPVMDIAKELYYKKFPIAILSNIDKDKANILRSMGCYDCFDPVLLSYQIGYAKPDPRAYEALLDTLPVPPTEIIFIDDKLENVLAAHRFGIDAIHYQQDPDKLREELEDRGIPISIERICGLIP